MGVSFCYRLYSLYERGSRIMRRLMNNFLTNMTMVNAHLVLEYAREYPTSLCGLNKEELYVYMAIVKNCEVKDGL